MLKRLFVFGAALLLTVACNTEYDKHYDKAKQLRKEGQLEEAVKEFLVAAELAPKKPKPLYRAAQVLKKMDLHTSAALYCEKALELDPEYVSVYPEFVKELKRSGQFDKALEVGKKALEMKIVKRDIAIVDEIKMELEDVERFRDAVKSGEWSPGQPLPPPPDLPTSGPQAAVQ